MSDRSITGVAGFRVLDQIGRGQLGPVFRAHDDIDDRLVAVKLFTIDLLPDRVHQLVAEFERLIQAPLDHPAIVKPLATGIYGATAYVVHEYVGGESLDQALRRQPRVPPSDVFRIAVALAAALDFAAAANVHHGRLHLGDVFWTDDVHITGIGITPALRRVGVAVPRRGAYAALGHASSDRHGDVAAFAAIVRTLLDEPPFAASPGEAIDAPLEIGSGDPAAVRHVFDCAFDGRKRNGFVSALEFTEALMTAFYAPRVSRAQPRDNASRHQGLFERSGSELAGSERRSALRPVSLALAIALMAAAAIGSFMSSGRRAEWTARRAETQTRVARSGDESGLRLSTPVGTTGRTRAEALHDDDGQQPERPRVSRRDASSATTFNRRSALPDDTAWDGQGSGGLFIDSQPRGAALFIDDKLIATTPVAVPSIAPGDHAVRLEIDGYRAWSSAVRVRANRLNRVVVTFDR